MTTTKKKSRGSEWRKWDLHFHTQSSFDYKNNSVTDEEIVAELISKGVAAIAVTDHHLIDKKRIKNLQALGKDKLLVLPGIEFRSELGGSELMHYIGIFSEKTDIDYIWKQLQVRCKIDDTDIARRGGYEKVFCDFKDTAKLIHAMGGLVSVHAGKKTNSIERLKNDIKDDLEVNKCIDILEIGNEIEQDIYRRIVFPNIKRIIPIVLCSDNHNIKEYSTKQTLWIKADLTFEGLKQTLYEPDDRVKIQALMPDLKNERHLISELQFIDKGKLVGNQKILLNENLNAIIGGKSSGKSLLIYSTAKSIDPEQVDKTSKRLGFEGYNFTTSFDLKVTWKNGDEDFLSDRDSPLKLHRITYIPQLYVNHLVEKNNKEELNSLIKNILLQDSSFKQFYENVNQRIISLTSEIEGSLNEYLKVRNKLIDVQQRKKEIGSSETIKKACESLESEILQGQKASNLSEVEFAEYNKLLSEKSTNDSTLLNINSKEAVLSDVLVEVKKSAATLLGKQDVSSNVFLKGQIDRILDNLGEVPSEIKAVKRKVETDFATLIFNLEKEILKFDFSKRREEIFERAKINSEKLAPYLQKIAGQKELQKLTTRLAEEKLKFQNAVSLEGQFESLVNEYESIRKQTATLLRERISEYKKIEQEVNSAKSNIGSGIELKSSLIYKLENFDLYDQVNKAAISADSFFNNFFNTGFVNYDLIPAFYENLLRVSDDKLFYSTNDNLPLRVRLSLEDILRGLVKDFFEIDYTVTYKGDNLLTMSPGKKGTVLLILFLQISSSEYPILIDQPEDNLDNRTIYDLLCKMIKEKKKDRQIIIVSHNANLVVATDTENIIVANQQGQEAEKDPNRYLFEYINGSLEDTMKKNDDLNSILLCQGIREHVCDILEGGNEAFKQREKKYSLNDV